MSTKITQAQVRQAQESIRQNQVRTEDKNDHNARERDLNREVLGL